MFREISEKILDIDKKCLEDLRGKWVITYFILEISRQVTVLAQP